MDPRISIITLGVANVARSATFYRDLSLPQLDVESDEVAFFTLEGTWLGLYRRDLLAEETHVDPNAAGPGAVTLAHNVESKERVDTVLREAEAAGGDIVQPGIDRPWGGYSGYFADPDGHRWEVAWNPDFEID